MVDLGGRGRCRASADRCATDAGGRRCLRDESCIDEGQYGDQEAEVLHATQDNLDVVMIR